ncbi:carbohydrate-binding protein [Flammeovirga sp. SubArs3]|uniref:carbohydrate-binding protein n=1 Tax=Flammeovirga sp. SubArs3 TaxID=2995316 RepID=UPI00248CEB26|nr:carbohydrate-binding protein [Flammeovirga sp. SubArs3]
MKKLLILAVALLLSLTTFSQDWSSIPVPADAGSGKEWELQENVSDDFNYTFNPVNSKSNFGNGKWYNFYHNTWDGPGTTYWKYQNVSVQNGRLLINASRWDQGNQSNPWNGNSAKMGLPNNGVNSGCVTSNSRVQYPVYVESSISVANIGLASCFWLLSPDDTQEIDIIENYGGVNGFKHLTHISHHSFIRSPFHDYQPRDWNSWWPDSRVSTSYGWGDWAWNNGNRRYLRLGVYWKTPNHFEYYIDGELVRVMYHNAIATLMNGTWEYTYYKEKNPANTTDAWGNNVGGMPTNGSNGYSEVITYATGSSFSFTTLQSASNASNGINVIDPGEYQGGTGFTKEMDIIINVESQSWLVSRGETPSDSDLADPSKNQMEIDWVRVYKPVNSSGGSDINVIGVNLSPSTLNLSTGETGNLTGQVVPANATDQTMVFTSNNESVATVTQSGVVTAVSEGNATITATTTDGGYTATSIIVVSDDAPVVGQPLVIEAENFTTTGGTFNDGFVPYGVSTSGVGINYVNSGDWTEYTVNASGTFDIDYSISTPITNGTNIELLVDGVSKANDAVPNNGGWDSYSNLSSSSQVTLSGVHTIRIIANGNNDWQWNLDKITLTPVSSNVSVTGVSLDQNNVSLQVSETAQLTAVVTPLNATNQTITWSSSNTNVASVNNGFISANGAGTANISVTTADGNHSATAVITVTNQPVTGVASFTIEAENFTTTGGTFNDGQVPYGMNIMAGVGVNWVNSGDWAQYSVNVPENGVYSIEYLVSTPMNGGTQIQLVVDGTVASTDAVPNNGLWDDYQSLSAGNTVSLSAGVHTFRVNALGSNDWQWNLDKINFSTGSNMREMAENTLSLAPEVYAYPNPTTRIVKVNGLANQDYEVLVYNLNGQQVHASTIAYRYKHQLDLSALPNGIYFISIVDHQTIRKVRIALMR